MTTGAKFYNCDFQVHTPRDINFVGKEYVSDIERRKYSEDFIKACREKKIDAVAITDHHDLEFYSYIKEAAENEIDTQGKPVSISERILVFPGMELTLDVPCQALLIFDAFLELDLTQRVKIYTALGIDDFAGHNESKTAQTKRLHIKDINEVESALNTIESIKSKFIVLPNVKHKDNFTIMRHGFHNQYKDGNFIAGYLDGPIYEKASSERGWSDIINGKTSAYGNRSIAVIQTSDNRTDSFENLGTGSTWIKFNLPTAEGLRQAFLAKECRVSQSEPQLPSSYLDEVEILNSSFLKNMKLKFSPQLNVLIGGRGTGKSSILHYIMYALGLESEMGKEKLGDFIKDTLETTGSVILTIYQNEVRHTIKRDSTTHLLRISDNAWETTNRDTLERILKVDAYTQKELSAHNVSRIGLVNHLVSFSIKLGIENLENKIRENQNEIGELFARYLTVISNRKRLKELQIRKMSLEQQNTELNKKLTGQKVDQTIIGRQSLIEAERAYVETLSSTYTKAFEDLNKFIAKAKFGIPGNEFKSVNTKELIALQNFVKMNMTLLRTKLEELTNLSDLTSFSDLKGKLEAKHELQDKEYNEAKLRMSESATFLSQIEINQKEIEGIGKDIEEISKSLDSNMGIEIKLFRLFLKRYKLAEEGFTLKKNEAKRLSSKSEGGLVVELLDFTDIDEIINLFDNKVKGAKGRTERIEAFFSDLVSKSGKHLRKRLFRFWYALFHCKNSEDKTLVAELEKLHFFNEDLTEKDLEAILESLSESDILECALKLPSYKPVMHYYKTKTESIRFSDASYGQQAGAILNVLFNQAHGALIIDQPEDDLDNKVIHQITERMSMSKENRQLIFSSHNANIAVNGDAELIIHLDHDATRAAGEIKTAGNIDNPEMREVIKDVMEGGEKAFTLRAKKYNFAY